MLCLYSSIQTFSLLGKQKEKALHQLNDLNEQFISFTKQKNYLLTIRPSSFAFNNQSVQI